MFEKVILETVNEDQVVWPKTWWQRNFGTPPAPVKGQIWRSDNNGELMKVSEARKHTSGTIFVSCENVYAHQPFSLADNYATGLHNWKVNLKYEKRQLLAYI